jgi:exodeoxyribonuclease V gamma subunit
VLNFHQSNRLETLAERLAHQTRTPLASVFFPDIVVVQSQGVARWLALQLARHNGVCANVRFQFPIAFAWEVYRRIADAPRNSPYERDVLIWRLMQSLPAMEPLPAFAPVQDYVAGASLRRYELARRLAENYEQYLIYRPDWLPQWERGENELWQAQLWRRIAEVSGAPHRVSLHRRVLEGLDAAAVARAGIPERLSIFGAPALPPMLLELFAALADHIDVHLFVTNPCREYWGDIAAAGDIARKKLAQRPDAAYLETGNSLLASLGKQGRDFIDLLQNHPAQEHDCFMDAGSGHLLDALQSDVLNLRERDHASALEVAVGDRSVQVHSCHSAMREVEVLHDQLLALFEQNGGLQPSDVVVMTPDIESYAPYIEAVFATAEPRIPFSISDRSAERDSPIAATFLALLDLPGSRYEANAVLALLDEPAVQRRFELQTDDLDIIHRWMRESGIRWGIDARHRAALGLPATAEHTWRFGLDRLLLGYALPGNDERAFGGVLPYDEVEGSLGQVLGRFASFAEAVIELDTMPAPRTVPQWAETLRALTARFFDPDESRDEEMEALRAAIAALQSDAQAGGYEGVIPIDVVTSALRRQLEAPGRGFLSGGVTFCAMVPMRTLPFEVVCLIGMNDGAFPRARRPYAFDLMADDFRKGDRSRRDDDRYLFLEALLSARRCFYLSYTGQHIRDNSVMPPSVLVSELLDHIAHGFRGPAGVDIRDHVLTRHALQPFSVRYFTGGALFSYSAPLCRAAEQAGKGSAIPEPLINDPLPAPGPEWRAVHIDALIRFFINPARFFIRERLGIRLEEADEEVAGREPFLPGGLESYELKQRLLGLRLGGHVLREALPIARGSGLLPHAQVGAALFQETGEEVEAFSSRVLNVLPDQTRDPVSFDLPAGEMQLRGTLAGMSAAGLLGYRLAKCRPKDLFDAWIRHLVLNVVAPTGIAPRTQWLLQDATLCFSPVPDAGAHLDQLMALYWQGLSRPLKFFPKSAKAYVEKGGVIDVARKAWAYSEHTYGEGDNPYYDLAFRGCDPLDAEFERLAVAVFGPMMAAMAVQEEGA